MATIPSNCAWQGLFLFCKPFEQPAVVNSLYSPIVPLFFNSLS